MLLDSFEPYSTIKTITGIAAPTVTIFSGLLGLYTEKREEVIVIKNGIEVKEKRLTKWATWALIGLILGFGTSLWSLINNYKLDNLSSASKAKKDSVYTSKVDSLNILLNKANFDLKSIAGYANQTKEKMDDSYNKQLTIIDKQNNLVNNSEQILHPLSPLVIKIHFRVELGLSIDSVLKEKIKTLKESNARSIPDYFEIGGTNLDNGKSLDVIYRMHSLIDPQKYSDEYFDFDQWVKSNILPELSAIGFYNRKQVFLGAKLIPFDPLSCEFLGLFPITDIFLPPNPMEMNDFLLFYNYDSDYHLLEGFFILKPKGTSEVQGGSQLRSLYQIKNGCLAISLRLFNEKFVFTKSKVQLKDIQLDCGLPTPEVFFSDIYDTDKIGPDNAGCYSIPLVHFMTNK